MHAIQFPLFSKMQCGAILFAATSCAFLNIANAVVSFNKNGIHPPYFYLAEGDDKCFLINAPDTMPISVTYQNRDNQGVSCSIHFKDPRGRQVFSREVDHAAPQGKVTYLTKIEGDYKICIGCPQSKWFSTSKIKWSLEINLGEDEESKLLLLQDAARTNEVSELENDMKVIMRRLDLLLTDTTHQEHEEKKYHSSSESVRFNILLFSMIKICILVLCATLSIYHLKKFFLSQKLI